MKTRKIIIKIIITTLLVYALTSCAQNIDKRGQNSRDNTEVLVKHKYKIGDIVYLKPDSIKVVIEELTATSDDLFSNVAPQDARPTYSLYYFRQDGLKVFERKVDEALIY